MIKREKRRKNINEMNLNELGERKIQLDIERDRVARKIRRLQALDCEIMEEQDCIELLAFRIHNPIEFDPQEPGTNDV